MANFFTPPAAPAAAPAQQNSLEAAAPNVQAHTQQTTAATATTEAAKAPLESFKGLWDTADTTQAAKPNGVLPAITAEQLSTTLANSNFLSGVNPELLAKAAGGDAQAFSDVINQGLRTVMTQSVLASHGMVEAGARSHGEQLRTELPSMVRSSNVTNTLQDNPMFNNPQARPMIEMVKAQLEAKNPTASAREIAELTQQFISDFAGMATPAADKATDAAGNKAGAEIDWFAMMGLQK